MEIQIAIITTIAALGGVFVTTLAEFVRTWFSLRETRRIERHKLLVNLIEKLINARAAYVGVRVLPHRSKDLLGPLPSSVVEPDEGRNEQKTRIAMAKAEITGICLVSGDKQLVELGLQLNQTSDPVTAIPIIDRSIERFGELIRSMS